MGEFLLSHSPTPVISANEHSGGVDLPVTCQRGTLSNVQAQGSESLTISLPSSLPVLVYTC